MYRAAAHGVRQAGSEELGAKEDTIHRDLGQCGLQLEDLQQEQIEKDANAAEKKPIMTAEEQAAALELLRDPRLLDRIVDDFERCGVVGEETNKRVELSGGGVAPAGNAAGDHGAVVIRGGQESLDGSGARLRAGRTARAVLGHDRAGALLHGRKNLKHKVLAIVGRGRRAARGLRAETVAAEGELTIASTGKDATSGTS